MQELTSITPYKVTSAETDMFARIRLSSMVNLLIQSAIDSAESLGFGFEAFSHQKLFWVISRFNIEIYRPLMWNEQGEVETWPKDLDKMLYIRDFIVRDSRQEIVARATSGWLAVETATKHPSIITGVEASMFNQLKEKHALHAFPAKLPPVHGEEVRELKADYFDIDINRHVTSTRYFDAMMDTFPVEFHQRHYPSKVAVNFMKETRYDDTVQLIRHAVNDRSYAFEGINKTRNITAFRGHIEF